jgi:hypothetical protein
MPWMLNKIPVKPQSGSYFWNFNSNYTLSTMDDHSHKAEVHATIAGTDIDKTKGTFKGFHVKFDVKTSSDLRIFFFFKDSGGSASPDTSKGTSESDALKKGIAKGEYSELRAEAITVSKQVAAKCKG